MLTIFCHEGFKIFVLHKKPLATEVRLFCHYQVCVENKVWILFFQLGILNSNDNCAVMSTPYSKTAL